MANIVRWLTIEEIEVRVCDIAADHLRLRREAVHSGLRLIEDLHCDSAGMVALVMTVEERLGASLPDGAPGTSSKSDFTHVPSKLYDLAELVYLQQGPKPSS